MANGHGNCIFAVCCPPGSEGQADALTGEIAAAVSLGGGAEYQGETLAPAYAVARFVLDRYDLAPKGSLQAFKDAIRDYAREGYAPINAKAGKDAPA